MDWLLSAPLINSAFSSLGAIDGDAYVVSPNALVILEEINYKLTCEDHTLRTFRRAIGLGQNVRSDLIPLLNNAKDYDVLDLAIRILVNLTLPVECLFSVDVMYRTEVGRQTLFELNKLLYNCKEAFTDSRSTKSVVEYMKHILESDTKLTPQRSDQINNCLLLLRNILHIPETQANFIVPSTYRQAGKVSPASMQNTILWNLFIQSIDKLLIYLITSSQRNFWGVTLVQLIAIMYKDQHVNMLQKQLSLWFEASLSESSDDNESNTSPSKQDSGDSSPMLTSDPTSDSSDNGSGQGKNEGSEDRRQALREEAEATLHKVSRKGHVYQNSLRIPMQKNDSAQDYTTKATEEMARSVSDRERHSFAMEQVTAEAMVTTSSSTHHESPKEVMHEQNIQSQRSREQPAERYKTTSEKVDQTESSKINDPDAFTFMPPPALPTRPLTSSSNHTADKHYADTPTLPSKKVPHSGQLKLIMGRSSPQKRECPSSQSELSDCGYATQAERESISTSSNDDDGPQGKPQHQKPPCNSKPRNKQRVVQTLTENNELRRKKLVKRSKCSLINMKGLVQHTPTDEDITNLLKEFTVDFLLKGYGHLVEEIHSQLLGDMKIAIDTSHFFWLVTYFLKFAAQLELDLEHVNAILNFEIISYLTYEGVTLCEQLDLNSRQQDSDSKACLQRIHLVVTAIRECLQAIETYKKVTHLSENDRERLQHLQVQISTTEDLRNLFVLLLRRFNPSLHSKQYLQDLVVTNHILLLIFDSVTRLDNGVHIKMEDHIAQFANLEVMHHYGMLLEEFTSNGEFVNNCIFTMMHHIGGDLGNIAALFQPTILKTFSRIWEADYELCDDWSDLIEYVIHKFINTPQKSPKEFQPVSLTELTKEHNLENTVCTWTQEEADTLYWYYVRSKKTNDVVGKIVNLFSSNGNKHKSRISIIQQLLQQDIITLVEYDDLMKFEDAEYQRALLTSPTSSTAESGIEIKDSLQYGKPSHDIQILLDLIIKAKTEEHLIWLQKLLLECCYVKLTLKQSCERRDYQNLKYIMEPVAYHSILKNKSIPIVQWNSDQATTMMYQPFVLLLHKLGFQLPADAGSVFARIPEFWTAETMYDLAKKLGPLEKLLIKFDASLLEELTASGDCHHVKSARASLSSISSIEVDFVETEEFGNSLSGNLTPVSEQDVLLENRTASSTASTEKYALTYNGSKHSNSIIRYTPEPVPISAIPNWLEVVMRSKCNTLVNENRRVSFDVAMSSSSEMSALKTATQNAARAAEMQPTTSEAAACIIGQIENTANNSNSNSNNSINVVDSSKKLMKACTQQQEQQQQQKPQQRRHQERQRSNEGNYNLNDADSAMKSMDEQDCCRNDSISSDNGTHHSGSGASGNLDSAYSAMVASYYQEEIANIETAASVSSELTQMYVSDEDEAEEFKNFN